MIGFRLHVNNGGGHVHFGVYCGEVPPGHVPSLTTYGFCGILSMRTDEYQAFVQALCTSNAIHFEEIVTEAVHG